MAISSIRPRMRGKRPFFPKFHVKLPGQGAPAVKELCWAVSMNGSQKRSSLSRTTRATRTRQRSQTSETEKRFHSGSQSCVQNQEACRFAKPPYRLFPASARIVHLLHHSSLCRIRKQAPRSHPHLRSHEQRQASVRPTNQCDHRRRCLICLHLQRNQDIGRCQA